MIEIIGEGRLGAKKSLCALKSSTARVMILERLSGLTLAGNSSLFSEPLPTLTPSGLEPEIRQVEIKERHDVYKGAERSRAWRSMAFHPRHWVGFVGFCLFEGFCH